MIGAWMTDALRERTAAQTTEDPMDHDSGVITHPKFRMWLRPDGIVQLVWVPRTTALLEDATAALEAMAQLTGGRKKAPAGGHARHGSAGPVRARRVDKPD
jgi:hypothetical protein